MKFTHKFVELVPEQIEERVVYVSIKYKTVSHRCACGCGREVVTPLSPAFWKLTFDGETVSLSPSIGNWGFPCQAHYWITNNQIRWSESFSREQIEEVNVRDQAAISQHYDRPVAEVPRAWAVDETPQRESRWAKFKKRWLRW